MKYDVMCPIRLINENFEENVETWFEEIPIKMLYLGIVSKDENVWNRLEAIPHENIQILDQRHYETLGGCLADLFKHITTKWFVYFHGDARPTKGSLAQMETFKNKKVGIIESEHMHVIEGKKEYKNYYDEPRSYSGFQLMYKPAIEKLIQHIEDDYIYRNEELITQNACEASGFKHVKCYALHFHYVTEINDMYTYSIERTQNMQWKGLVKYSSLITPLMRHLVIDSIQYNLENFGLKIEEILQFVKDNNEMWMDVIKERFGWLK